MGLAVSCSGDDALDESFDAVLMRTISLNGDNTMRSTLRSVSFNGRDSDPAILKTFGSGKFLIEGSLSFKKEGDDPFQLERKISIKSPSSEENPMRATFRTSRFNPLNERAPASPVVIEPECPKYKAAVKMQKVYKSFRTRRQLADCAVLVEQRWWKLLDFALLKQSSVSFFDVEEPESVASRWLRARRRAATVGKGLSKDIKAQKLALQHWLEAIDPRHRYGHNLHFYYDCWIRCESKQPFFYWLDVGEGKEVNLEDKCPRSKLQHQCIKYLGPKEREAFEVIVQDGKLLYKRSEELLDTSEGPKDTKWIFVLSTSKTLYVGQKKKGSFQHSSFLAGGATSAAGRLVVEKGILKAVWPHSGHYRPTEQNFHDFVSFLKENNVELTNVKLSPTEGEEELLALKSFHSELDFPAGTEIGLQSSYESCGIRDPEVSKSTRPFESSNGANNSSTELKLEGDITEKASFNLEEYQKLENNILPEDQEESGNEYDGKTDHLELKRTDTSLLKEHSADSQFGDREMVEDPNVSEGHYMFCKHNLFLEEEEEGEDESVPKEAILRRINSKKGMESYQLGKQLSCKWTTGAGPRIGWVRDYPSEMQFRALEQVNLSPRSDRSHPSPRVPSTSSPRMQFRALEQVNLSPRSDRSHPSPRVPSTSSPRMAEVPLLRQVPLLQMPNIHRK